MRPITDPEDGRFEVRRRAHRAQAAEELADLFRQQAIDHFVSREPVAADIKLSASEFAAGWAKNERECQARLEKIHGRYDA